MKKTIAIILTTMLMASAAASCTEAPSHTTRTSSTTRERETTAPTEETTSETTSELQVNFTTLDTLTCVTTGEHAMTPEAEEAYYEAFIDVDELPGTPVALLAQRQTDDSTVYIIIENGGAMSYSGMDVYHITEVYSYNRGGACSRVVEYLPFEVGFGVNDLIYNLPDTYDIDTDLLALYAENAPVGYETPFMQAACNNTGDVFIADGEDNTIAFVAIDNDGNSEILLTYDYSPLL